MDDMDLSANVNGTSGENKADSNLEKEPVEKSGDFKTELFEWFESIVYSIVLVFVVLTFIVRTVGVDGSSMLQTLQDRDMVLMRELLYQPKVGDVVVVTKDVRPLVKRIIAMGGQTVDIDFNQGVVYVDDEMLYEPYINAPTYREGDMEFPLVVPEGHVFVMGDNRNASSDSRESMVGFVDERYVMGRVFFRIFPLDTIGIIKSETYPDA